MKALLEKIKILDYKYQKLRDKDKFNIFNILGNASDETYLHSPFLAVLLDPNESHGMGDKFLKKFLERCCISDFDTKEIVVHKEYSKGNSRIDILIKNKKKAIVIENKIWAPDQPQQLQRYYEIVIDEKYQEENILIIYLSPFGKEPSDLSLGYLKENKNLDKLLKIITYQYDIKEWIDDCIQISALYPTLRETLLQYKNLISQITGSTMEIKEREELFDLLSENDNAIQAEKLVANWIHIRWITEWNFWIDFESIISREYTILSNQKYSEERLTNVIHRSRNREAYYGLMFEISSTEEYRYCVFIERAVSGNLYYGLTILDKKFDRLDTCNSKKFADLAQKIDSDRPVNKYWLGGKYLESHINFDAFNGEIIKLINKENRIKYLEKNWIKIKEFAQKCKVAIETTDIK